MMRPTSDWSTHQLAEFVALVSSYRDENAALAGAAERAAEALEAEIGVAVLDGDVRASIGFARGAVPVDAVLSLGAGPGECTVDLPDFEAPPGEVREQRLAVWRAREQQPAVRFVVGFEQGDSGHVGNSLSWSILGRERVSGRGR